MKKLQFLGVKHRNVILKHQDCIKNFIKKLSISVSYFCKFFIFVIILDLQRLKPFTLKWYHRQEMTKLSNEQYSSKSEFIWCSSSRRLKNLDCNPFVIGADAVQAKNEVRELGLILDSDLSMTSQITGLVRTSFAILRQLRSVSRSLTQGIRLPI